MGLLDIPIMATVLQKKLISAISKLPNVVSYNAKIDGGYWGIPENFEPIPGMVNAPGLSIPYTAVLDSSLDIKFFKWNI